MEISIISERLIDMSDMNNTRLTTKNGKFKLLMVSDFHAGDRINPKLIKGFEALLDYTEPDAVFLGGDNLCVNRSAVTEKEFRYLLSVILEPVESRGIPWFHCYGNHDAEGGFSNEFQQSVYETFPYCITEAGPEDVSGVGNYVKTIYSSATGEPVFNLWTMDSHSENTVMAEKFGLKGSDSCIRMPNPLGGFNSSHSSVYFDQVYWYYNKSLEMEKELGKKIPGLLFLHVPPMEMNLIWANPEETGMIGSKRQEIYGASINSGLLMACLQRGDVKGIYAGHEHLCNFEGTYCGIKLGYDSSLGFNMSAHDDLRGGRLFEINEDGSWSTRHIKLIKLMGKEAMRNPEFLEGGDLYNIRTL